MGVLKSSVDLRLEVTAHVDRLRSLCDQLDAALSTPDRAHIKDLAARARAVIHLIERDVERDPE